MALKLVEKMQQHPDTEKQLKRLNRGRDFLKTNNLTDRESLEAYLEEEED